MEEEERRKMRRKRTRRRRKRRRREEREGGRERGNERFAVVASDCRAAARFVVDSSGLDGTVSSSGRYYLATANERRRLVAVLVVSFSSSFPLVLAKPIKPFPIVRTTTTTATSTIHHHLSTATTTTATTSVTTTTTCTEIGSD